MTAAARAPGTLGLRTRVTLAFALGAALLSVSMAVLTFGVTRNYLVRQRESAAIRQTYVNARLVRAGLRSANPDVPRLLGSLETPAGSQSLVLYQGRWFSSSLAVGRDTLPTELREVVSEGEPARQRFRSDGESFLAVGLPVPAVDASYFEVFELRELDRTLRVMAFSLVGGAFATTAAGAALGLWASARILRPLREVSRAAVDVASGDLDTRLDASADPDLVNLTVSFNAMVDALQERLERDARFASDVSHELRSPLTTIRTSLEVLKSRADELSDRGRRALDLLTGDVERFERLVQDLLEISRVDAGAVELSTEEVQLAELVRRAVDASRRDVPVVVEQGAEDAVVVVEKRRIERVLANLLDNATVHGGGPTRVLVSADGTHATVAVDDAGPGIPEHLRELVFERFSRGGAAGSRSAGGQGVGLGLALVSEHVRLHGGEVWAEESPEGGARFVVRLPEAPE